MTGITVWFEAVGQCFFSLGISFGPLIMFGSYNDFKHNIYRDAWIVSGLDTFTSLFAGFTVFAVLGNLAGELNVEVGEVARGGAGLTFISFAQGLGTFTVVPQLFSVLFYLMLLTLGIGTGVSLTGGIITIICDQFPRIPRWQVVTGVCIGGFCIGLIYVTPGGQFMLDLTDHFGANFVIYMMGTLEVGAVAWVYGLNKFLNDLEFMLGIKLGWYWKFCWGFASPCGLTVILVYILATEERRTFNDLAFPDWAIILGWMIAAVAFMVIPTLAIVSLVQSKADGFLGKLKDIAKPSKDWGPKKPKFRREWEAFKAKQT
jgi:solute carrier family 6 amino acid transporter-like protein 5/7/9/14